MGHFAQVVNGVVKQVIVANTEYIEERISKRLDIIDCEWVKTSYNTRGGIHYGEDGLPDDKPALRANFAGIGYIYDSVNDVFYPPSPGEGYTISGPDWTWKPPV